MMVCRVAKKAIYIVSCKIQATYTDHDITVLRDCYYVRKHTMRFTFRSFYSLVLTIQSTTVIEFIPLEFINFNRNGIRLPREAFSISRAKTLKPD